MDTFIIIVQGFKISLSVIHGKSRHEINKDIKDLNNIINQLNPMFIEHSIQQQHIKCFLSAQGKFTKIDHILGQNKP